MREDLVDEENAITYRDFDDLSDDEEAAMEISDQSDDGGDDEPAAKRARRTEDDTDAAKSVPKWSNPDAETALPPEDAQRKKKDVVKLIRKARIEDNAAAKLAASTEAEDFISFDFGDDQGEDDEDAQESVNRPAPTEPRRDPVSNQQAPAKSGPPSGPARDRVDYPRAPQASSDPLGTRKRTIDDEIKPPSYGPLKKGVKTPARGKVVPEWAPVRNEDPCPWLVKDHSQTSEMSVWYVHCIVAMQSSH